MTKTRNKPESRSSGSTFEERHRMIAEAAYFKAEHRDFRNGSPDDDWHEGEAEIEATLNKRDSR